MRFKKLEVVVLTHDIPKQELRAGDPGTLVEIYPGGGVVLVVVVVVGVGIGFDETTAI